MYYNKATIIGNLTRDPEMRTLPSGVPVASFSVATNRVWRDKDGSKKEDAQFHNVVVFGKQAEIVSKYVKKGTLLLVEGRMQTRSWDDAQGGGKKYRTEIVAESIQFGPRSGAGVGGGSPTSAPSFDGGKKQDDVIEYPDEAINPEDIPF